MIVDQERREAVLDPRRSFIVQAPAGSGKTTLLTKRFLHLLETVDEPEEIIAVTFTRKAAAEMRHRIITVLEKEGKTHPKIISWRLIENPNRLRIMTIDALCSMIAHQMPILSRSGGKYDIATDPRGYYHEAVEKCLLLTTKVDPWYEAWKTLLLHFNNRVDKIKSLFSSLLAKREQWMIYLSVIQRDPECLEEEMAALLTGVIEEHLEKMALQFSAEVKSQLVELLHYAGKNAFEEDIIHPIQGWATTQDFPLPTIDYLTDWRALAQVLLTQEGTWRKQFTRTTGFLSPSTTSNKEEKKRRKIHIDAMLSILASLQEQDTQDTLREALEGLSLFPPIDWSGSQRRIVAALGELLPVLVGFLNIIFKSVNQVDFTEVTLSAWTALGEMLAPSDVALRLDYHIKHILIDEYQDTSVIQHKIFEKLVLGWQPGEGRTLFLVGDPMQSIYRFRGAEVNIFLSTQQEGLGGIALENVQLSTNFRSQAGIIQWMNERFCHIFPQQPNRLESAVNYIQAFSPHESPLCTVGKVYTHGLLTLKAKEQDHYIADLIEQLRQVSTQESVAVLVRARSHLEGLIPILKKRGIPFIAHEVEQLAKRPHIMDLLTLINATTDLSDRVAWLALLRSPLLGLSLAELLAIGEEDPRVPVWHTLQQKIFSSRIQRFVETLQYWMAYRHRSPLVHWVRGLWVALGGEHCYPHPREKEDREAIEGWLREYDRGGVLSDREGWNKKIRELYADVIPRQEKDNAVQIMTIHKAKGLEFDHVIIPHAEATTRHHDPDLLLWQTFPHQEENNILLGVHPALGEGENKLYDFIRYLQKRKEEHEARRLLYVAASRAKMALHIVGEYEETKTGEKRIPQGSFARMLADSGEEFIYVANIDENPLTNTDSPAPRKMRRLKEGWSLPAAFERYQSHKKAQPSVDNNMPGLVDPLFRAMGTVFHRVMQWKIMEKSIEEMKRIVSLSLRREGVPGDKIASSMATIMEAREKLQADSQGRWLLEKDHTEIQREWALSVRTPYGVEHVKIDHAFVDKQGIRWIVDYKLVQSSVFSLQEESEKYHAQLVRYAKIVSQLENRRIKMGLYFPLQQAWIEWEALENVESVL